MILNPLTTNILRRYLLRLPLSQRVSRYQSLMTVAWLQATLKQIKPEVLPDESLPSDLEKGEMQDTIQPLPPYYRQYRCTQGDPLICREHTSTPGEPTSLICHQCYFPAWLTPEQQLIGKQGQYQINQPLGRRGISRLYAGIHLGSEESIIIQEYLLPSRYFNTDEQRRYQEQFIGLAGIALADGRSQDIRIVAPSDVIVDPAGDRCYLITPAFNRTPTLNQYCAHHGPFTESMVRDLLNQALQTLIFLHQQRFTVPTGQVQQGVIHGNLNLNSLLWAANTDDRPPHGFVYVTDFHLWTNLFDPAIIERGDLGAQDELSIQDDLGSLGQVAFWVLNGTTVDDHGYSLNPRLNSHWPKETDKDLQQFIRRLIGPDVTFESAEAARNALLELPPPLAISHRETRAAAVVAPKKTWYRRLIPFVAVGAVVLAVLGGLLWLVWRSQQTRRLAQSVLPPCCLKDVDGIPSGEYTYAIPDLAYWQPLFQPLPDAQDRTNIVAQIPGLLDRAAMLQPDLTFKRYRPESEPKTDDFEDKSVAAAIAAVQSGQADFAIVPITQSLPPDVTATIIAYDSLVPVVAFSYFKRKGSLPTALQGKVTMTDLEKLYDNKITNWDELSSVELPVKRYWSDDGTNQEIFQQLATGNRSSEISTSPSSVNEQPSEQPLSLLPMLRRILQDFETDDTGSMAIAPLSQIFGQCSVYPLALEDGRRAISPLVFDTGKVVTPASDLCDRKGSYAPHGDVIRAGTYPLAYPLAIVYPLDNTRSAIGKGLAQLLLTQESQTHLTTSGMVSAYPQPKNAQSSPNLHSSPDYSVPIPKTLTPPDKPAVPDAPPNLPPLATQLPPHGHSAPLNQLPKPVAVAVPPMDLPTSHRFLVDI
nr:substrate-binding domain-containing protein [Leptothoe spongobia]